MSRAHRAGDALTAPAASIATLGVLLLLLGRFEIGAVLVGLAAVLGAFAAYLLGRPDRRSWRCPRRAGSTLCILLRGHEGTHLP